MAETRLRRAGRGLCCDGHTSGPRVGLWPRPRRPRTSSSTRRPGLGPSGESCSAPTTATSLPRTSLERSPEDLYGALASHRELAASRPQGTATVRVVMPDHRGRGMVGVGSLGGRGRHRRHALPGRLGDHGAQPARATTSTVSSTRSSPSSATSPAPCARWPSSTTTGWPSQLGIARGVVDARRDRPHGRRRGHRHRGGRAARAARRPRVGGGLGEDARPGAGRRHRARGQPAAAPGGRG